MEDWKDAYRSPRSPSPNLPIPPSPYQPLQLVRFHEQLQRFVIGTNLLLNLLADQPSSQLEEAAKFGSRDRGQQRSLSLWLEGIGDFNGVRAVEAFEIESVGWLPGRNLDLRINFASQKSGHNFHG